MLNLKIMQTDLNSFTQFWFSVPTCTELVSQAIVHDVYSFIQRLHIYQKKHFFTLKFFLF